MKWHGVAVRFWILVAALTAGAFFSQAEEEGSARRLDQAQQGMADASWPKKPDSRLSPLSGKMKDMAQIAPRSYGGGKEFRVRPMKELNRESPLGSRAGWEAEAGRNWEEVRWNQERDWSEAGEKNQDFHPTRDLASVNTVNYREMDRENSPDWSSRSSRLVGRGDGSLRMYEGRLKRVREQVWEAKQDGRDLGPDRQEKFRPEEVEKMLAQPAAEIGQGATERSPSASPLAAAGN